VKWRAESGQAPFSGKRPRRWALLRPSRAIQPPSDPARNRRQTVCAVCKRPLSHIRMKSTMRTFAAFGCGSPCGNTRTNQIISIDALCLVNSTRSAYFGGDGSCWREPARRVCAPCPNVESPFAVSVLRVDDDPVYVVAVLREGAVLGREAQPTA
jgi:hypothetical protein